ncbi:MAG TPA: DUF3307 domain-containing protein [Candidatus Limnocylindria bacterium]|nr:DUF3307 domain-containing protein [Candidatus Limnocylindria bacterium]
MMADPVLTLAWLVLAHLAADFILQTRGMAREKFQSGRRAWRGLAAHLGGVTLCLLPVPVAFGVPGLAFLLAVVIAHAVIDRAKIVWTRHAEAVAIVQAHRQHEAAPGPEGLGSAWTPVPAALFVGDQLAHLGVIAWAWAVWLSAAPLTSAWVSVAGAAMGAWDPAIVARTTLVSLVLLDLAIVNVRAADMFVATLVHPREVVTGHEAGVGQEAATGHHADGGEAVVPGSPVVDGSPVVTGSTVVTGSAVQPVSRAPSPARIGATIGVLERLLIVAFVLTGAQAAIGFVVAAKTLARFKQLDDRQFAEYYLLGTLASVSVALGTGLLAVAALR